MDQLEYILLGVIQGLTEFLPISSSGHIEVGKFFMDKFYKPIQLTDSVQFSLFLHLGTVFSTLIVFRRDIIKIFTGLFFKDPKLSSRPYVYRIIVSLIPLIPMYFFKDTVEELGGNILFVGFMLIITGAILGITQLNFTKLTKPLSYKTALIIGVAQALAVIPGISRSGSTISAALLSGVNRNEAARFSFLMVLPAIIGASLLDFIDSDFQLFTQTSNVTGYWLGFLAAFVTGLVACQAMIKLVKNGKLSFFSLYCLIIGLVCIYFGWDESLAGY